VTFAISLQPAASPAADILDAVEPRTADTSVRIGDRYLLEERIGSGAMGAVWRGTDELLNRRVAIKELIAAAEPPTAAGSDALAEARQRLMREGRIGARLQHPHVISMFDVVVHDDRPWLIMEYLPSRSLAAALAENGPMSPREAADVGRQVADGLAAAHAAGVVHRDVKPGNVLLGNAGQVKITDFGVSRAVDDVQLTRTGLIAGTPAFLAPEVARGLQPTAASDVFALGATLYTVVEGRPPFGLDDNAYALLHKVATEEVEPPSRAGPLTALLMRLLARDPAARPTAAQACEALAAISAALPVDEPRTAVLAAPPAAPAPVASASEEPAAAEPPRRGRRSPVLLMLLALVLLGGGLTTALLVGGPGGGGTELPAAQPETSAPAASPSTTPTRTAQPPTPSPQPTPQNETDEPAASPPSTDPVAFVRDYYALLPGNTDAAWPLLSSTAKQASGGRGGFDRFYGGMESVRIEDVTDVGGGVVRATVVFDRRDGPTTREPYRFVISRDKDGGAIIQSFNRL
jgi:serine/threonine protein kinase